LFKNNIADEADFCEAYKSQILNHDTEDKESPLASILIILFLLALIIALSIFGYKYITNNEASASLLSSSVKVISDEELKVTEEELTVSSDSELKSKEIKKIVVKSFNELPKSKSLDDLADKIKIDMSENEKNNSKDKKETTEDREVVPIEIETSPDSTYVEDLAKLTAEIDKYRE
jgi:cytoskeletal protein RodZ